MNKTKFSSKLNELCINQKLSNKKAVIVLQNKNYNEFGKLDTVTFSRWKTGTTRPSLYKQLYVLKYLGCSIERALLEDRLSFLPACKKKERIFDNFVRNVDFSMAALSYHHYVSDHQLEEHIFCTEEYENYFGEFYNNINSLKLLKDEIYTKSKNINYNVFVVKNKLGFMLGHLSSYRNLRLIVKNHTKLLNITSDEVKGSVLVDLFYYKNSKIFFEILTYSLAKYLENCINKIEFAYVFIPSLKPVVRLSELVFDAELVRSFPSTNHTLGVHLMKFDLMKVIASPIVIKNLRSFLIDISDKNTTIK